MFVVGAGSLLTVAVLAATPAVAITPPSGSDDTCPSARQVTEALQAHLPGQIQAVDRGGVPPRPDALRALLDVPADGTVVHFSLVDARGEVQLRRSIPAPGRGRPSAECLALAETLAVIVDRYLASVPYQAAESEPPVAPPLANIAAPSPPPAGGPAAAGRATYVYAGGAWQMSSSSQSVFEANVGVEVELTRSARPLVGFLRGGAAQDESVSLSTGMASLRRFPARLGLFLELPAGPGSFEPTLEAGFDIFLGSSTDTVSDRGERAARWSPVVGAETGYRVALGRRLFIRPRASLGFAIVRYDVAVGGGNEVVFHTPASFSTFGLDAGFVFR
ncbi:MAG TPA: hypothetical protein VGP07_26060 [Polyangia bacterium]|jgi:hypothetical protein